jgi:hypothetical protein
MPDEILEDLETAVAAAANTFNGRGSTVKERELEMALETALWALDRKPRRQAVIRLEQAWWGRVGGVDLALEDSGGMILIELKWDPQTLAACAWDSIKLAAALQAGEGTRAFLVAGSPLLDGLRGDELLEDTETRPAKLRRRYFKEFDFWKGDVKNHPLLAPAGWRTQLIQTATFNFKAAPWRIRLAEISVTNDQLAPFE